MVGAFFVVGGGSGRNLTKGPVFKLIAVLFGEGFGSGEGSRDTKNLERGELGTEGGL